MTETSAKAHAFRDHRRDRLPSSALGRSVVTYLLLPATSKSEKVHSNHNSKNNSLHGINICTTVWTVNDVTCPRPDAYTLWEIDIFNGHILT